MVQLLSGIFFGITSIHLASRAGQPSYLVLLPTRFAYALRTSYAVCNQNTTASSWENTKRIKPPVLIAWSGHAERFRPELCYEYIQSRLSPP
jgi:hypothetical protein